MAPPRSQPVAFTLIEMLLVVAIIVLLLALLLPSLGRSKGEARVVKCAANLRGFYTAVQQYQLEFHMRHPWEFANGSGDWPHESGHSAGRPGTPARALMVLTDILDNPRLFFCPDVPIDYETAFNPAPPSDNKTFHGTYGYLYHHIARWEDATPAGNSITYINPASKDVVYVDVSHQTWSTWNYPYRHEHYNALMVQGHVERVADNARDMNHWLWGDAGKPYD